MILQLLYLLSVWYSVSGRVDEIEQLIHNGIKDGLWPRDWKPDSVTGTMKSYLTEKVKSFNKKIKIDNKKREYREKLTEQS